MTRHDAVAGELDRLAGLFRRIDDAYGLAAGRYGFRCDGCSQTCCGERFYHFTLAEALFLERGLAARPAEERARYFNSAAGVVSLMLREKSADSLTPVLCPLYTGEGCGLYDHRPLICRLHGIPYDYAPPGREPVRGEGCHRFGEEIEPLGKTYQPFDRTPWFGEMAAIEIAIRRRLNCNERFRRTVADMLVEIGAPGDRED